MEIELDAFSGRPNPKWTAPPEKAAELLKKLDSLPEAESAPPVPDLGFRGFILRFNSRTVRVYRGFAIAEQSGRSRAYRDTAGVQAELERDARQRGFSAVFEDKNQ